MSQKKIKRSIFSKIVNQVFLLFNSFILFILEIFTNPTWFPYRVQAIANRFLFNRYHLSRHSEYNAHSRSVLDSISFILKKNQSEIMEIIGYDLADKTQNKDSIGQDINGDSPIPSRFNGTNDFLEAIYICCKILKPKNIVETGVARGSSTVTILTAINENNTGKLYSVDLPAFIWNYKSHIGELVEEKLKKNWSLSIGPTGKILPKILSELGEIDLFIHDSSHSYHSQKEDYENAMKYLAPGGILISDDISNDAFLELAESSGCRWSVISQPKYYPIGILIKGLD